MKVNVGDVITASDMKGERIVRYVGVLCGMGNVNWVWYCLRNDSEWDGKLRPESRGGMLYRICNNDNIKIVKRVRVDAGCRCSDCVAMRAYNLKSGDAGVAGVDGDEKIWVGDIVTVIRAGTGCTGNASCCADFLGKEMQVKEFNYGYKNKYWLIEADGGGEGCSMFQRGDFIFLRRGGDER